MILVRDPRISRRVNCVDIYRPWGSGRVLAMGYRFLSHCLLPLFVQSDTFIGKPGWRDRECPSKARIRFCRAGREDCRAPADKAEDEEKGENELFHNGLLLISDNARPHDERRHDGHGTVCATV